MKTAKGQLEVAKAKVSMLEQERDDALKRAKAVERELEKVKNEEKRKLKMADTKGY